jgi:hypothetical protein
MFININITLTNDNVYHEMSQHFFFYDREFQLQDEFLKANNCNKIIHYSKRIK